MQHIRPTFFFLAWMGVFLSGLMVNLQANDCGSAINISAGCQFSPIDNALNYAIAQNNCGFTNPQGDAWFRYEPGGSNLVQQDVDFQVTTNFNGRINVLLLYSESKDAGNPCDWAGSNAQALTRYGNSRCDVGVTTGNSITLQGRGLDGSGTFFIVVEKVVGTGNVQVCPNVIGTCNAPANDRCANATVLGIGSGIDTTTNGNGLPDWANAITGTTRCATKQRLQGGNCTGIFNNPPAPTEDHFSTGIPFGGVPGCLLNRIVGGTDDFLENTVFFRFTVPVTKYYRIFLSSPTQCSSEPNNMAAAVVSGLNCNDASAANQMASLRFNTFGSYPSAEAISDTIEFIAGNTYHIILDGTRSSQCAVKILVAANTADNINPVLPASIEAFEGQNLGRRNQLSWAATAEGNHHYYAIQRSSDGRSYQEIGQVSSQGVENGEIATYEFTDHFAPPGQAFYRLRLVDLAGAETFSPTLTLYRESRPLELLALSPVPVRHELKVTYTSREGGRLQVDLLDLTGRRVQQWQRQSEPGNHELSLSTEGLPAGIYLLRLSQGSEVVVQRLVKE